MEMIQAARCLGGFSFASRGRLSTITVVTGDSAQNTPPPQTKPTFLQRPAGLRSPKYCGMGGRRYGQTEDQAELPSPSASAAGSGSLQIGYAQQPRLASLAPRVRVCYRPVHRLVLLRTQTGLQSHRSRALPHAPGVTRSSGQHHQPTTRSRAPPCSRGRRLGLAESRVGCGDHPSERSQATRVSLRQLAECRAKFRGAQTCLRRYHACQTRLCDAGHAVRMWLSQIGTSGFGNG